MGCAANPADEMVLETAINGQAKALVTFNQRDFGKAPAAFGFELLLQSVHCNGGRREAGGIGCRTLF
jgi:hypothetical protein